MERRTFLANVSAALGVASAVQALVLWGVYEGIIDAQGHDGAGSAPAALKLIEAYSPIPTLTAVSSLVLFVWELVCRRLWWVLITALSLLVSLPAGRVISAFFF